MKKKRKIKIALLSIIFILFITPVLLFQLPDVQDYLRDKVLTHLKDKLKKNVTIKRLRVSLDGSFYLEDLKVYESLDSKEPLLKIKRLDLKLKILPLLQRKIQVNHLILNSPMFRYHAKKREIVSSHKKRFPINQFMSILRVDKLEIKNGAFYFMKEEPFNEVTVSNFYFLCTSKKPGVFYVDQINMGSVRYSRKPGERAGFTISAHAKSGIRVKLGPTLKESILTGKLSVILGLNKSRVDVQNIWMTDFTSPRISGEFQSNTNLKDIKDFFNVINVPLTGTSKIEGTFEGPIKNPVVKGLVHISQMNIAKLQFKQVNAPFTFWNREIEIDNLLAQSFGGTLKAELLIHTRESNRGIEGKGSFENLDINQILNNVNMPLGVSGKLNGGARFVMDRFRKENLNARGWVYSKLGAEADYFHLPIGFDSTFTINNQRVHVDKALIKSENSYIIADGSVGFDKTMNLRYVIHSKDLGELSRRIEYNRAVKKNSLDKLIPKISPVSSQPNQPLILNSNLLLRQQERPKLLQQVPFSGSGSLVGTAKGSFRQAVLSSKFELENGNLFNFTWEYLGGDLNYDFSNNQLQTEHLILVDKGGRIEARAQMDFSKYLQKNLNNHSHKSRFLDKVPDMKAELHFKNYPSQPIVKSIPQNIRIDTTFSGEIVVTHAKNVFIANGNLVAKNATIYGEHFDNIGIVSFLCTEDYFQTESITVKKGGSNCSGRIKISFDGNYSLELESFKLSLADMNLVSNYPYSIKGLISLQGSVNGSGKKFKFIQLAGNFTDIQYRNNFPETGSFSISETNNENVYIYITNKPGSIEITASLLSPLQNIFNGKLFLRNYPVQSILAIFGKENVFKNLTGEITSITDFNFPVNAIVQGRFKSVVDRLLLQLPNYTFQNEQPIHFDIQDNTLELAKFTVKGTNTRFTTSGYVNSDKTLGFLFEGYLGLDILKLYSDQVHITEGNINTSMEILGTVSDPELRGLATIEGGKIKFLDITESFNNIQARMSFGPSILKIENMHSSFAGGEINVFGDIGIKKGKMDYLALRMYGENLRLNYPEGLRSIIDRFDLNWTGQISNSIITGSIDIREAAYRKDIDYRRFEWEIFEQTLFSTGTENISEPPENGFDPRLDININNLHRFLIDNNLLTAEILPSITIGGTCYNPIPLGNVEIPDGEITYKSIKFVNAEGFIYFSDPKRVNPYFNITGRTKKNIYSPPTKEFEEYTIFIHMRGPLDTLRIDYSSDPVLPPEILAGALGFDVTPLHLGKAQRYLEKPFTFLVSRFQINPIFQRENTEIFGKGLSGDWNLQVSAGLDIPVSDRIFKNSVIYNVISGETFYLLEIPWNKNLFIMGEWERSGGISTFGGNLKFHWEFE